MIESVVDKFDALYPFTSKTLGYVFKKDINGVFYPCKQNGNEYKQVLDFNTLYDFHYWYLTGDVRSEDLSNRYGVKKIYKLSFPMRIFICRKEVCTDNLVLKFYKEIDKLNMQVRASLNILNCDISVNSFNLIRETILEQEFNTIPKLMDKYNVASIDLDLIIEIDKSCIDVC